MQGDGTEGDGTEGDGMQGEVVGGRIQKPLYIVDGSGYIYRAFYAVHPLSTSTGLPTNALYGFTRMLVKLLREFQAEYVSVVFDSAGTNFRHEMYDQYKANRKECPELLVPQFPYFRKIVRAFGLSCLEESGFEADDIIATLVKNLQERFEKVIVVSGDKDLTQLVTPRVSILDAMRGIEYDEKGVEEKFGVPPCLIGDLLALTGDTSDNIPGVPGIGPKTAVSLLLHFSSLSALIEGVDTISAIPGLRGAKGVQEKIKSHLDQLMLSRQMVELHSDVGSVRGVTEPDALRWRFRHLVFGPRAEGDGSGEQTALSEPAPAVPTLTCAAEPYELPPSPEAIKVLFSELEFLNLKDIAGVLSEAKAEGAPEAPQRPVPVSPPLAQYQKVTLANYEQFLEGLNAARSLAVDTETTSLDPLSCELVGISLSWKPHEAWFVVSPLPDRPSESSAFESVLLGQSQEGATEISRESEREEQEKVWALVRGPLTEALLDPARLKMGANLKYDINVLATHHIELTSPFFDCVIASHLLRPDGRGHGLKQLSKTILEEEMGSFEEMMQGYSDIRRVPEERLVAYACHDADATFRVAEGLDKRLLGSGETPPSLRYLFEQVEMPIVPILARMERTGIRIDREYLRELSERFNGEAKALDAQVQELAGEPFNLNSPKQLGEVLFNRLGLPTAGVKKTQTAFSTDASVLYKLQHLHPIVPVILEYREVFKLKSTYVDALEKLVRPDTGRIHTSFNQAVAATGRLSSSEPNLQNVPIRTARGRTLRRLFVAEPGRVLISADYSQIELRLLAHLSRDEALISAFSRDEDIHELTAKMIFGGLSFGGDLSASEARRIAKTINFGVIYGMGPHRLAEELGISRGQADGFIKQYFNRYPGVQRYFAEVMRQCDELGYVETLFGRRRYIEDLDTSGRDKGYARRSLLNAPIQGSAAEIMKIAMIRVEERLRDVRCGVFSTSGPRSGVQAPGTQGLGIQAVGAVQTARAMSETSDADRDRIDKNLGSGIWAEMVLQVHDEIVVEVDARHGESLSAVIAEEMAGAVQLLVPLKSEVVISERWGD